VNPTPTAALSELLVSLFDSEELRIFLAAQEGGPDVLTRLPDGPVSLRELVFRAITVLERHGRIDGGFFDALANSFPRRRDAILLVGERWHRSPAVMTSAASSARAASGAHDGIFVDEQSGCIRTFFSA